MFTVALIGPDGAGKTTIGRLLEHELPFPVKYIYMGVNVDAGNHLLPTTRLKRAVKRALGLRTAAGGPRPAGAKLDRPARMAVCFVAVKSALNLLNRLAEEWYRQFLSWCYTQRRFIVVYDRHYFPDYYAHDIADDGVKKPLGRRIHGFF